MKWEDPPEPKKGAQSALDEVLPELKKNPGRWAMIGEFTPVVAYQWRQRHTEVEITSRTIEKKQGKTTRVAIYARWIGNES